MSWLAILEQERNVGSDASGRTVAEGREARSSSRHVEQRDVIAQDQRDEMTAHATERFLDLPEIRAARTVAGSFPRAPRSTLSRFSNSSASEAWTLSCRA